MFYLHLSNRTENLLTHLVEVLRAQPRRDLFAKEFFLIQSQGMERMLSQRLAEAFTVWCNFEYLLPTRFFDLMAARLGMVINPDAFDRQALTWRLDGLLQQIAAQAQPQETLPLFAPLLRYMSGEQSGLKRFQLALQLANIFDQYQIMRPEMLDGWQQQKTCTDNPAEAWQLALWTELRASLNNSPHRGELLRQFLRRLQATEDFSAILPARLSVFGLHSMPPLLLDCLQAISGHCDVHLYLLSPCENYWADMPGMRQLIRENISRLQNNLEPLPLIPEIHPLLNALGRQGQDFQTMLCERIDTLHEITSFTDPRPNDTHTAPCLLHRLQADLLDGRWQARQDDEPIPLDPSLTMVSCHSAVREMMILKDQILRWLQENPDMTLRDIVVMAPDIQDYTAIIPAIFDDVQHSIADRSLRQQNTTMAIFLQFLDLAVSRFSWTDVLGLLEKPEVAAAFHLSEADGELIRHWIIRCGIRWGLSAEPPSDPDESATPGHPRPAVAPAPAQAEITWEAGLDRLLLGYAMDWDLPMAGILPYPDIEGSQARPLGGLCQFIELLARVARDCSHSRPLAGWSTLLLSCLDSLFGPETENDINPLREMLATLGSRFGAFHHHDLPLTVIRAWLETAAQESKSSAGFLRGQLTFCSMLPMRSIPFQAVCLLGLNDGVFPKTDRHPPFDLLGERFLPGDRSKRGDDRYQFLEALLSARRFFYLSHVGQSIRSGSTIPPSVLITELVETLRLSYGIEEPVQRHPLQPFSARYFRRRDGDLFSHNEHNCAVAKALATPPTSYDPEPWWSGTLADDDQRTVTVPDLLSFFAHPQRWFVRHRLDIRLDNEDELPGESELFAVTGLDRYLVNQELVQTCLDHDRQTGAEADTALLTRLKAQGRWMLGAPGRLAFDRLLPELSAFAARIQAKNMGLRLPDLVIDLQIGDVRLVGQLADVYENGTLLARYAECKGKDLLRAWIHHLLAAATRPAAPAATHLLTKDRDLCFPPCRDPLLRLTELLAVFHQGYRSPSPLLVEPAWTYLQQQENPRAKTPPLQAAITALATRLEKGQEPELALLYGDDCQAATLFGPDFQRLCENFLGPVWAAVEQNP